MFRPASIISIVLLALAAGCDRESAAPTPAATVPVRPTLQIRPIAPLLPARRTHVAIDPRGNVFWTQEAEGGGADDVVFSLGDDGVPRATRLTAAAVLAETNEAGGAKAVGNIQSLAFGPDGALYFYVTGGTDKRAIAAFGKFVPSASVIQIVAPTKQLMSAAGMGRDLALARGTVVVSGLRIVVWLRHTDASAMLELVGHSAAAGGSSASLELKRAPAIEAETGSLRLTRASQLLAPGRDGSLLLIDPSTGGLYVVDAAGKAVTLQELAGLPQALSLPATDASGRVVVFGGAGPTFPPHTEEQAALSMLEHPALMTLDGTRVQAIRRKDFTAHPGFPVAGMKLQQLAPDRAGGAYVAYDESSGELIRLRVLGNDSTADER